MIQISKYIRGIGNYFGFTRNPSISVYVGELYIVIVSAGNGADKRQMNQGGIVHIEMDQTEVEKNSIQVKCFIKDIYTPRSSEGVKQDYNNNALIHAIKEAALLFGFNNQMVNVWMVIDNDIVSKDTVTLPLDVPENNITEEMAAFLEEKYNVIVDDIYYDYETNMQEDHKEIKLYFTEKNKLANLLDSAFYDSAIKFQALEIDSLALQKFVNHAMSTNILEDFCCLEINMQKIKILFFCDNKIIDAKSFKIKELFNVSTNMELMAIISLSFVDFFTTIVNFVFNSGKINFHSPRPNAFFSSNDLDGNNIGAKRHIFCAGELIYFYYDKYIECKDKIYENFALQDISHDSLSKNVSINITNTPLNSAEKFMAFAPVFGTALCSKPSVKSIEVEHGYY